MKLLITLNDAPYGSERCYNGLRLAGSLVKQDNIELKIFLAGDAAICAKSGQKVPQGFYSVQNMLAVVTRRGGKVGVCGTCMDARGLDDAGLMAGAQRSTMDELAAATVDADKVMVF